MNQIDPVSRSSATNCSSKALPTALFFLLAFFLIAHDLHYSVKISSGSIPSSDEIISTVASGSVTRRFALLALGLWAVPSLLRNRGANLRVNGILGGLMILFSIWATLSILWTSAASQVLVRLFVLAILCLTSAAVVRCFEFRQVLQWVALSSGVYLFIGVLAEIVLGTFHPLSSGYRFEGTISPNNQGINCALFLISSAALARTSRSRQVLFRASEIIAFGFLLLTGSRTAGICGMIALVVYEALSRVYSLHKLILGATLAVGAAGCVLGLTNEVKANEITNTTVLGRDPSANSSLSGRIDLWADLIPYFKQRSVIGYGYGGFWTPERVSEISSEEKWGVPNAHSAYLDYLLSLGLVGSSIYILILAGGIATAFRNHLRAPASTTAFAVALIVFCALNGFMESAIFEGSFPMCLLTVTLFYLAFTTRFTRCTEYLRVVPIPKHA